MADAKRLAKNTLFMYIRMIFIMLVSIYTSRVVLDKLGADDYGLYNAVASIVALVSFLNAALSTSTSRFLTYDLGKGDDEKLKQTFSMSFYTHLILAAIVVVVLESLGLWYMDHKFVIPEGREFAVHTVYQISVFMTAISIIRVPYTSSIIAHESMGIYAYIGIADAVLRLVVAYLLTISETLDRLVFYASLLAAEQFIVTIVYYAVSRNQYVETKLIRCFSGETLKRMMGFTGWTAVANLSNSMLVQGPIMLLNLFFAPAIIAAKALADQLSNAVIQFVDNFRMALNPQIIKSYAAGEIDEFKKWSLRSTVIAFNLMMMIGLPCVVTMKAILNLWLIEVPPMAVEFTQLAILAQIIGSISSSTYIPFVASGKLRLNALWGVITAAGYFIALYFIYKVGGGALWAQWLYLVMGLISVLLLRPYLLHKDVGFSYKEVYKCIWDCFKPMSLACIASYILMITFNDTVIQQFILFITVFAVTAIVSWFFLESSMRNFIVTLIKSKIPFLHNEKGSVN